MQPDRRWRCSLRSVPGRQNECPTGRYRSRYAGSMRPGVVALALCVLISCKQSPAPPPAGAAGSATNSIAAAAGSGSAAPAAGLAFDQVAADEPPEAPALAFAGKVPRLPAVSADGSQLAVFGYPGSGPMMPPPISIELHQ